MASTVLNEGKLWRYVESFDLSEFLCAANPGLVPNAAALLKVTSKSNNIRKIKINEKSPLILSQFLEEIGGKLTDFHISGSVVPWKRVICKLDTRIITELRIRKSDQESALAALHLLESAGGLKRLKRLSISLEEVDRALRAEERLMDALSASHGVLETLRVICRNTDGVNALLSKMKAVGDANSSTLKNVHFELSSWESSAVPVYQAISDAIDFPDLQKHPDLIRHWEVHGERMVSIYGVPLSALHVGSRWSTLWTHYMSHDIGATVADIKKFDPLFQLCYGDRPTKHTSDLFSTGDLVFDAPDAAPPIEWSISFILKWLEPEFWDAATFAEKRHSMHAAIGMLSTFQELKERYGSESEAKLLGRHLYEAVRDKILSEPKTLSLMPLGRFWQVFFADPKVQQHGDSLDLSGVWTAGKKGLAKKTFASDASVFSYFLQCSGGGILSRQCKGIVKRLMSPYKEYSAPLLAKYLRLYPQFPASYSSQLRLLDEDTIRFILSQGETLESFVEAFLYDLPRYAKTLAAVIGDCKVTWTSVHAPKEATDRIAQTVAHAVAKFASSNAEMQAAITAFELVLPELQSLIPQLRRDPN